MARKRKRGHTMQTGQFLTELDSYRYYPMLAQVVGGVKEAVLLCSMIKRLPTNDSQEMQITQDEIVTSTGLTHEEQKSARKVLKEKGLLERRYARLEHQMYFTVNLPRLIELWQGGQSRAY